MSEQNKFQALYANEKGQVWEAPRTSMLGRNGRVWVEPEPEEMIPLPTGASLVSIAGHVPVVLEGDEI